MSDFRIDASTRSFIDVDPQSHFPIQNLPYGVFSRMGDEKRRAGVAIGEQVFDLTLAEERGLFSEASFAAERYFSRGKLNDFMAAGRAIWSEARSSIGRLLSTGEGGLKDDPELAGRLLVPASEAKMHLPAEIGDYTDFYSSREHATNVGTMFRGRDNALQPNWLQLPVAYHGRASSIVISGTDVRRPVGQSMPEGADAPRFGPSRLLDFELEMGYFVGPGNHLGSPIPVERAADHLFGFVLVNDWSARDIQKWEYVPLGPFLGKSFATSISPWIVTLDALEPFRCDGPKQEPEPLPYLRSQGPRAYDILLEVGLHGEDMDRPFIVCRSNFKYLYWNICQQLAHHASNGCNMRPGDLLASGTISGPTPASFGSMLELAWRGERPLRFPGGAERVFLKDGDLVSLTGWAQGEGFRVGFGDVSARVLPAES